MHMGRGHMHMGRVTCTWGGSHAHGEGSHAHSEGTDIAGCMCYYNRGGSKVQSSLSPILLMYTCPQCADMVALL